MKHRIIDSPLGPLTLVVDADGVLCALYNEGQRYFPEAAALGERDDTVAEDAVAQLREYFAGTRSAFTVPTAAVGTAFQHRVWEALAAIPPGTTPHLRSSGPRVGVHPAPHVPWVRQRDATRSASSCPATGWWGPQAP
ncbi:methylated-DNA--[protein]-cysteine S-methyltransferase [Propioniciclava flava]